jgi:hypothetical protein
MPQEPPPHFSVSFNWLEWGVESGERLDLASRMA